MTPARTIVLFATLLLIASPALAQRSAATAPGLAQSPAPTSPAGDVADAGFGGSLAGSGDNIFAGDAPGGWPTGRKPAGTVYRFARGGDGAWMERDRLQASDGRLGDLFGRALAASGERLVIGAPGLDAVFVFAPSASGEWAETARLSPTVIEEGYEFGGAYARAAMRSGAVATSGSRIAVASYNTATSDGVVHVFRMEGESWIEDAAIRSATAEPGDRFGWSVAIDGDHLFVGAPGASDGEGAVHVFAKQDAAWQEVARLTIEGADARSSLGQSLAAGAGGLYAGAPGLSESGTVIRYEAAEPGGTWAETVRMTPESGEDDAPLLRGYGGVLSFGGGTLAIGARGGAAIIGDDGTQYVLSAPDDRTTRGFGMSVASLGQHVAVGSPLADYDAGLATVFGRDMDGEWSPEGMFASELNFLESVSGDKVDCEDGKAGAFDCDAVDLVSFLSLPELSEERGVRMTDIWGWEDPDTGKEWVLQARTEGVSFVDISDAAHPVYVGQLLKTATSPGAAWRDVKVYRNHAYIVADGSEDHGVQIFDLTQLRDVRPEDMPVTFEETAHYGGVHSTHNIVINEETGFAYAVGNRAGGETCGGQLHIIDIREPANPKFAGCFSNDGAGGTHDAQCVVYRGADADYVGREVCFNSNGSSFIIADVTDKEHAVTISRNTYPLTAYTHQGWLTEDHEYFYMNDELDEMNGLVARTRTLIWDVKDLEDPQLVNEFLLDSGASDHNLYVRGTFMYQSNYQAGLRILDISDPVRPVEVGNFDTAPYSEDAAGFGGSWSNYPFFRSGIIAVSSRSEGLFLLRKQERDL